MGGKPRSIARLMFDRSVGGIFWGKVFTTTGMWMHSVIAAVVVFDHTGSAFMVGMVSSAQFVPQLLLAPLAGALADRGHGRRQVTLGRSLCLVASGGLAVLVALGGLDDTHTVALLLVASLMLGVGFAIGGPPLHAMVPSMVRAEELPAAMSLNSAPMTVARITGPAVGAVIVGPLGPAVALGVSAACHVVFFALLRWVIRLPADAPHPRGAKNRPERAGGLGVDGRIVLLLVAVAAVTAFSEPSLALAPALSTEFGQGAAGVAYMSVAFGVGAAFGACVSPALMRLTSADAGVPTGLLLLGASSAVVAAADLWGVVLSSLVLGGFGFSLCATAATTLIQLQVAPRIRGRIMAWWLVAFVGARPLGGISIGMIADATTTDFGFMASAAGAAVVSLACGKQFLLRAMGLKPRTE